MAVIGVAGIARANITPQGFESNLAWSSDFVNAYRVPRSSEEFDQQVATGLIKKESAALDRKKYTFQSALRKDWWSFHNNTVEFDQTNGPPEEVALATNFSCSDDVRLSYRINWSNWIPMICGVDFGKIGFDSLKIDSLEIAPQIDDKWTLVGVNLMNNGLNSIVEGDNILAIKATFGNQDSLQFLFHVVYRIR